MSKCHIVGNLMSAKILLLLPCGYYCSMSSPHGTVRKSACVIAADPGPEVIKLFVLN